MWLGARGERSGAGIPPPLIGRLETYTTRIGPLPVSTRSEAPERHGGEPSGQEDRGGGFGNDTGLVIPARFIGGGQRPFLETSAVREGLTEAGIEDT